MPDQDVTVRKVPKQDELTEQPEHCAMDPQTVAALGVDVGQQVRITRTNGNRALYTIRRTQDETPHDIVRMGLDGRQRLGKEGTIDAFRAVASARILRSDLSDCEAEDVGEFVERLDDAGGHDLIVVAPHGGDIEPHTDEQAKWVATRFPAGQVSAWVCKGWQPVAAEADYHITSGDLSAVSFPLLGQVIGRGFTHAVSFHGFQPLADQPDVLVGGAAHECLRQLFVDAIVAALAGTGLTVRLARPKERFGGDDAENVVNRLTKDGTNGVQIEQSSRARKKRGAAIADAVAEVYLRVLTGVGAATPR
jgi:phage replication-related protein YjqB (UPF0714/DUF867 family)